MTYTLAYITQRQAFAFIAEHHRHHKPPQGAIVCIAAMLGEKLIGVAVVGRPVSRMLQAKGALEVTRTCVLEGYPNAASWLLTRAKRAAQAIGAKSVVTYTLPSEGGASLKAAGFTNEGVAGGGQWTKPSRPRKAHGNDQQKFRWTA